MNTLEKIEQLLEDFIKISHRLNIDEKISKVRAIYDLIPDYLEEYKSGIIEKNERNELFHKGLFLVYFFYTTKHYGALFNVGILNNPIH